MTKCSYCGRDRILTITMHDDLHKEKDPVCCGCIVRMGNEILEDDSR